MATETEVKYLVINDNWKQHVKTTSSIEQGYLTPSSSNGAIVRVRIKDNKSACLTIKGPTTILPNGIPTKMEMEYDIPLTDAQEMMKLSRERIIKVRHLVQLGIYEWEVDIFGGALTGLVLAELEDRTGVTPFPPTQLPDFVGADVSLDFRYSNARLAVDGLPPDERLGLR